MKIPMKLFDKENDISIYIGECAHSAVFLATTDLQSNKKTVCGIVQSESLGITMCLSSWEKILKNAKTFRNRLSEGHT